MLDRDGRPVRGQLVEIWQANAAGRYAHLRDQHPAPLDPNFTGVGRCLTDDDGTYEFTTVKPGAYPWRNHDNAWRPAHIHFSLFGTAFTQRLVTQMYFPGDPLFAYDPILQSVTDEAARDRLVATYDHDLSMPEWSLGYQWDIVLDGPPPPGSRRTCMTMPPRPPPDGGPFSATPCRSPAARTSSPERHPDTLPSTARVRRGGRPGPRRDPGDLAGRTATGRGAGGPAPRPGDRRPRRTASPASAGSPPTPTATRRSAPCARAARSRTSPCCVFARGLLHHLYHPSLLPPARPATTPTRCCRGPAPSGATR